MYKCYLTWCNKKKHPLFLAGMETDWNLLPWQPSPPPRLLPRPAWCPSPCDSEPHPACQNLWKQQLWWLCRRDGHMTASLVLESRIPEAWCDRGSPSVFSVLMWPHEEFLFTHSCPRDVFCVHQVSPRLGTYYATTDLIQLWSFNTQELVFLSNMFSSDLHQ